jgi:hypothetical protein
LISGVAQSGAELFRPVGFPSRYFISIPRQPQPDLDYRWFMVDFDGRFAAHPSFGTTCPFGSPCLDRGRAFGLLLTDPKLEDHWKVDFTSNGVEFSNGTLTIGLTQTQ